MTANAFRTLSAAVVILLAGSFMYSAAQTVTGSIADGKAHIGKPTRVTVVLDIPAELHTNSNAPGSEYAIPTTVKATAEGVKVGPITYPPGKSKKFEFSENELNIYEGRVEFGFDITVPKGYKKYSVVVDVAVRYQACTNEVCYPPKTKKITLSAPVI